ncbi:hypothetical protein FGB62_8g23 [Gracilaria domingensis]|nr:hypothetical protein FGB62_8g23 [Gracilaria domingensis]
MLLESRRLSECAHRVRHAKRNAGQKARSLRRAQPRAQAHALADHRGAPAHAHERARARALIRGATLALHGELQPEDLAWVTSEVFAMASNRRAPQRVEVDVAGGCFSS